VETEPCKFKFILGSKLCAHLKHHHDNGSPVCIIFQNEGGGDEICVVIGCDHAQAPDDGVV
jgi:hypothetical protein